MAHELHKIRVRAALKPRKEPYWGPNVADDLCVGFRKVSETEGYWIARWRRGDPLPGQRRYEEDPLGLATAANDYEAARAAALEWRKGKHAGVPDKSFTVADACREYVEDREREKGKETAQDARKRFERCVYERAFGQQQLERLKTPAIKKWLAELNLSAASERRTLASWKAAMNLAVANRRAHPAVAHEWHDVKPRKGASKRRDLFLDRTQRLALLERIQGALRDLVEAAALTGARAGELTGAKRTQYDRRTKMMTFVGKTGTRTVPLSPDAATLFQRLSESKLPAAPLLVRDDPDMAGKPWKHSDWDELIAEASQLANLPAGVCLYTLRHSFITELLLGGLPTLEVARLVGTSVQMIEKHYGHLVASAARERLAALRIL
jgi:integrase